MRLAVRLFIVLLLSSVSAPAFPQENAASPQPKRKSQAGRMLDDQAGGSAPAAMPSEAEATSSTAEAEAGMEAVPVKRTMRLPRYFSSLVSEPQRAEIYRIQLEYLERVQQLQQQLDALKAEELAACEQVLDESQRSRLVDMRDIAMQRAKARAAAMRGQKPMDREQDGDGSVGNTVVTAGAESDTQ